MTKTKEEQKDKRLQDTYGITLQEWKDMLELQGGVCWICQTMPKSGILCVDHAHQKGYKTMPMAEKKKYVRGLLCYMCNVGLKGFEKTTDGKRNRKSLERTYEYFKAFKLKGEL